MIYEMQSLMQHEQPLMDLMWLKIYIKDIRFEKMLDLTKIESSLN